jgi:hypothetical protein
MPLLTTVPTTSDQRLNKLVVYTYLNTSFDDAERCALALTLLEMKGVADWSTRRNLILPTVTDRCASGTRFAEIINNDQQPEWHRVPNWRKLCNAQSHTKSFQRFFNTFQLKNSVPQNNQTTGL